MDASLRESPYSFHFRMLTYLGGWVWESDDETSLILHNIYRSAVSFLEIVAIFSLIADLYNVIEDFKKMVWNLCVTILVVGIVTKVLILMNKTDIVNQLRKKLHKEEQSRTSPEDIVIHNIALKELRLLRLSFYGSASLSVPSWLILRYLSYLWGNKELPVPFSLPIEIDFDDFWQYNYAFAISAFLGMIGISLVIEVELSMFSIMVQISREYRILMKDMQKLNEMYEDSNVLQGNSDFGKDKNIETNPWLKREKTKMLVKELCHKQQKIIKYTEEFEYCYNASLLFQFFGVSVLITLNALQCLLQSVDLSGNLIYQFGYLFVNLTDLYLICWFSSRLEAQCLEVGEAAYSTLWYRMSTDIQKDIGLIIMRSQHPPKITSGKLMEMNLSVFMHRMSNIYSWLALFRQLEFKYNS